MEKIIRTDITSEKELGKAVIAISKAEPEKYVTYHVSFGKSWGQFKTSFFIYNKKPQSPNVPGAEECYRDHGGFFKNGEIIKPSNTFIRKYEFCPFLG